MKYIYQLTIISSTDKFSTFFSCLHNLFIFIKENFFNQIPGINCRWLNVWMHYYAHNHTGKVFLKRNIELKDCLTFLGTWSIKIQTWGGAFASTNFRVLLKIDSLLWFDCINFYSCTLCKINIIISQLYLKVWANMTNNYDNRTNPIFLSNLIKIKLNLFAKNLDFKSSFDANDIIKIWHDIKHDSNKIW
jgi:hypothetical protein